MNRKLIQQAIDALIPFVRYGRPGSRDVETKAALDCIIALDGALSKLDNIVPPPTTEYTTGHCQNHKMPGGCHLHNLHCGWPQCNRKYNDS